MTTENIFETATREKFRFPAQIGELTVEQLWDLPLSSPGSKATLDAVARQVNSELKGVTEESFVNPKPNAVVKHLESKLDIVKHIIAVKQEEEAARKARADRAAEKKILIEALARKKDEKLANMSEEEILKRLEQL